MDTTEDKGRSRWKGSGPGLRLPLCESTKRVLASTELPSCWSQRAQQRIEAIRTEFSWLDRDCTSLIVGEDGRPEWWTFAGKKANASLVAGLTEILNYPITHDSLTIRFDLDIPTPSINAAIDNLRSTAIHSMMPNVDEEALSGLKFSDCLPKDLALHVLQSRTFDEFAVKSTLAKCVSVILQ